MKRVFFISFMLILLNVTIVWADPVLQQIYFTKGSSLTPATYTFKFSLWDVATGGDPLINKVWEEEKSITLTSSTISTYLGSIVSIAAVDFSEQYWVQVERETAPDTWVAVGGRTKFKVVPYAMWSAQGGDVTSVIAGNGLTGPATTGDVTLGIASGGVTSSMLASGAITSGVISAGAITTAKIATGAVTDAKITGPVSIVHGGTASTTATAALTALGAVKKAGDTMTGTLTLPANGLTAGTDQLVLSGGNVGIGTTTPSQKLSVSGNVKISGAGNGLTFPDGSKQTKAVTGGGGGVPSGFMILGDNKTAPAGYTYTGKAIGMPGSWAAKADMPTARFTPAAAVVNNRIYLIGGSTTSGLPLAGVTVNEEYDPATNTWSTKTPMPTPRYALDAAVVNNKVYAIGGITGAAGSSPGLAVNEEYDPVANTWSTKAPMITARYDFGAATVNNKIYAIGGWNSPSTLATNEEYDPATNTWATRTNMPTARLGAGAAVVNNRVYIIGGVHSSSWEAPLQTTEAYDPATNAWTTKASMPTARAGLGAAVVNNRIYAIGASSANEEYEPATNTWATKASMPTARSGLAVAVVNNKVYAIGGTLSFAGIPLANNEEFTPELLYVHKKN